MPRYYFDTQDGEFSVHDNEGVECANLDEAGALAVKSLPEMARDALPDGDRRDFIVEVRDETGKPVLGATLSLNVEHL